MSTQRNRCAEYLGWMVMARAQTEVPSQRTRSVKSQMLGTNYGNFSERITPVALRAGLCLRRLWNSAVYWWWGCSKQRGAVCYLADLYLLTSLASCILDAHFSSLFLSFWHSSTNSRRLPENCFFWPVVARLQYSLIVGTSAQYKFKFTIIIQIMI